MTLSAKTPKVNTVSLYKSSNLCIVNIIENIKMFTISKFIFHDFFYRQILKIPNSNLTDETTMLTFSCNKKGVDYKYSRENFHIIFFDTELLVHKYLKTFCLMLLFNPFIFSIISDYIRRWKRKINIKKKRKTFSWHSPQKLHDNVHLSRRFWYSHVFALTS